MVWAAIYQDEIDGIHNITIWEQKDDALLEVCSEIIADINDNWDLTDPDYVSKAQELDKLILMQQFDQAIDKYNQLSVTEGWGISWSLQDYSIYPAGKGSVPGHVVFPVTMSVQTSQTTTPLAAPQGATCRGPCSQYNEFAHADQSNGSYLCSQCKTFQSIFGVIS